MEKEDKETLLHISKTLDEMLEIQKKPRSKIERFFEILGTIVTVLGVLTIIDVVRNWFGG